MKTNKSYSKRLKVTKNGKTVARKIGQNHYNAKKTGEERIKSRRTSSFPLSKHALRRFLPGK